MLNFFWCSKFPVRGLSLSVQSLQDNILFFYKTREEAVVKIVVKQYFFTTCTPKVARKHKLQRETKFFI